MDEDITKSVLLNENKHSVKTISETTVDTINDNTVVNKRLQTTLTDVSNTVGPSVMQHVVLGDPCVTTPNYILQSGDLNIPYQNLYISPQTISEHYNSSQICKSTTSDICIENVSVDDEDIQILKTSKKKANDTSMMLMQCKIIGSNPQLNDTETVNLLVPSDKSAEECASLMLDTSEISGEFDESSCSKLLTLHKTNREGFLEQSNCNESDVTEADIVRNLPAGGYNGDEVCADEGHNAGLFQEEKLDIALEINPLQIENSTVLGDKTDSQINMPHINEESSKIGEISHSQCTGNNSCEMNKLNISVQDLQVKAINNQHSCASRSEIVKNISSRSFHNKFTSKNSNIINSHPASIIGKNITKRRKKPAKSLKQFHVGQKMKMLTDFQFLVSSKQQRMPPTQTCDVKALNTNQKTLLLTRTQPHSMTAAVNTVVAMADVPQLRKPKKTSGSFVFQNFSNCKERKQNMILIQDIPSKTEQPVELKETPRMLHSLTDTSQFAVDTQNNKLDSLVSSIVVIVPPTSNWEVPCLNASKVETSSVIFSRSSLFCQVPAKIIKSKEIIPISKRSSATQKDTLKVTRILSENESLKLPGRICKVQHNSKKSEESVFPIVEKHPNGKGVKFVYSSRDLMAMYKRLSAAVPLIAEPIEVAKVSIPQSDILSRTSELHKEEEVVFKTMPELGNDASAKKETKLPFLESSSNKPKHNSTSTNQSLFDISQSKSVSEFVPHLKFNSKMLQTYKYQKNSKCLSLPDNKEALCCSTKMASSCGETDTKNVEIELSEDQNFYLSSDTTTYEDVAKRKNLLEGLLLHPVNYKMSCENMKKTNINMKPNITQLQTPIEENRVNLPLEKSLSIREAILKDFELSDDDDDDTVDQENLCVDVPSSNSDTKREFSNVSELKTMEKFQYQPFMADKMKATMKNDKSAEKCVPFAVQSEIMPVSQSTESFGEVIPNVENASQTILTAHSVLVQDCKVNKMESNKMLSSPRLFQKFQCIKDPEVKGNTMQILLPKVISCSTVCAGTKERVQPVEERRLMTSSETSVISTLKCPKIIADIVKSGIVVSCMSADHFSLSKIQVFWEGNASLISSLESLCRSDVIQNCVFGKMWNIQVPYKISSKSLIVEELGNIQDNKSAVSVISQNVAKNFRERTVPFVSSSTANTLLQNESCANKKENNSEESHISLNITSPVAVVHVTNPSSIDSAYTCNTMDTISLGIDVKSLKIPVVVRNRISANSTDVSRRSFEIPDMNPRVFNLSHAHQESELPEFATSKITSLQMDNANDKFKSLVSDTLDISVLKKASLLFDEFVEKRENQNLSTPLFSDEMEISLQEELCLRETDITTLKDGTTFQSHVNKESVGSTGALDLPLRKDSLEVPETERDFQMDVKKAVFPLKNKSSIGVETNLDVHCKCNKVRNVESFSAPMTFFCDCKAKSNVEHETQKMFTTESHGNIERKASGSDNALKKGLSLFNKDVLSVPCRTTRDSESESPCSKIPDEIKDASNNTPLDCDNSESQVYLKKVHGTGPNINVSSVTDVFYSREKSKIFSETEIPPNLQNDTCMESEAASGLPANTNYKEVQLQELVEKDVAKLDTNTRGEEIQSNLKSNKHLPEMKNRISQLNTQHCSNSSSDGTAVKNTELENLESQHMKLSSLVSSAEEEMVICDSRKLTPPTLASAPNALAPLASCSKGLVELDQQVSAECGDSVTAEIVPRAVSEPNRGYGFVSDANINNIEAHKNSAFVTKIIQEVETSNCVEPKVVSQERSQNGDKEEEFIDNISTNVVTKGKADQNVKHEDQTNLKQKVLSFYEQPIVKNRREENCDLEIKNISETKSTNLIPTEKTNEHYCLQQSLMQVNDSDNEKKFLSDGTFKLSVQFENINELDLEISESKQMSRNSGQSKLRKDIKFHEEECGSLVNKKSKYCKYSTFKKNVECLQEAVTTDILGERTTVDNDSVKDEYLLQEKKTKHLHVVSVQSKTFDSKEEEECFEEHYTASLKTEEFSVPRNRPIYSKNETLSENLVQNETFILKQDSVNEICLEEIRGEKMKENYITMSNICAKDKSNLSEEPLFEHMQHSQQKQDDMAVFANPKINVDVHDNAINATVVATLQADMKNDKEIGIKNRKVNRRKQSLEELRLPEDVVKFELVSLMPTNFDSEKAVKTQRIYGRCKSSLTTAQKKSENTLGVKKSKTYIRKKTIKKTYIPNACSEESSINNKSLENPTCKTLCEMKPRKLIFDKLTSPETPETAFKRCDFDNSNIEMCKKHTNTTPGNLTLTKEKDAVQKNSSNKPLTRSSRRQCQRIPNKDHKMSSTNKESRLYVKLMPPVSSVKPNTEKSTRLGLRTRIHLQRQAKLPSMTLSVSNVERDSLQRKSSGKLEKKLVQQTESQMDSKDCVQGNKKRSSKGISSKCMDMKEDNKSSKTSVNESAMESVMKKSPLNIPLPSTVEESEKKFEAAMKQPCSPTASFLSEVEDAISVAKPVNTNSIAVTRCFRRGRLKNQKLSQTDSIKKRSANLRQKGKYVKHVKDLSLIQKNVLQSQTKKKLNVLKRRERFKNQSVIDESFLCDRRASEFNIVPEMKRCSPKQVRHSESAITRSLKDQMKSTCWRRFEVFKCSPRKSVKLSIGKEANVIDKQITNNKSVQKCINKAPSSDMESAGEKLKLPVQTLKKRLPGRTRGHKMSSEVIITPLKQLLNSKTSGLRKLNTEKDCNEKELEACVQRRKSCFQEKSSKRTYGRRGLKKLNTFSEGLITTSTEGEVKMQNLESSVQTLCDNDIVKVTVPSVKKRECETFESREVQSAQSCIEVLAETAKEEFLKDVENNVEKLFGKEQSFARNFSPVECESSVIENVSESWKSRLRHQHFMNTPKNTVDKYSSQTVSLENKASNMIVKTQEFLLDPEYECIDLPNTTLFLQVPSEDVGTSTKQGSDVKSKVPEYKGYEGNFSEFGGPSKKLAEINEELKQYCAEQDFNCSSDATGSFLNYECLDLPKSAILTAELQKQETSHLLNDLYNIHVNLSDVSECLAGPKWPLSMKEKKCYVGKKKRLSESIYDFEDDIQTQEDTIKELYNKREDILSFNACQPSSRKKCYPGKRKVTETKSEQDVLNDVPSMSLERNCCEKEGESENSGLNVEAVSGAKYDFDKMSTEDLELNISEQNTSMNKLSNVNLIDNKGSVCAQKVYKSCIQTLKRCRRQPKNDMDCEYARAGKRSRESFSKSREEDINIKTVVKNVPGVSGNHCLHSESTSDLSISSKINENFKSLREDSIDGTLNSLLPEIDSGEIPLKIKNPVLRQSGRPFHIPPHLLGRSITDPTSDVASRSRPMQRPRLGVRVPYRNLTSQIVTSKEIVTELLERSKARNKAIAMAMNKKVADCVEKTFTKNANAHASLTRLPMTPDDKNRLSAILAPKTPAAKKINQDVWRIDLPDVPNVIGSSATITTRATTSATGCSVKTGNLAKLPCVSSGLVSGNKKIANRQEPNIFPMDKEMERAIALKQLEELPTRKRFSNVDDIGSANIRDETVKKEVMPVILTEMKPCRKRCRTEPVVAENNLRKASLKRK